MNGFVSTPAAPASPLGSSVAADGWFPAVDISNIRDTLRIGEGVVTGPRMYAAAEGAILTALQALSEWRSIHAAAGIDNLDDLDNMTVGGRLRTVILWERIIRYYTAADLADDYRDISATNDGVTRGEEENITADEYRRKAHNAVSDLLSIGAAVPVARNIVELI